jgi:hypothetical protein
LQDVEVDLMAESEALETERNSSSPRRTEQTPRAAPSAGREGALKSPEFKTPFSYCITELIHLQINQITTA